MSSSIHLCGPGAVGRALLRRLGRERGRVVAVTDSTATLTAEAGIDLAAVVRWKERGRPLRDFPRARAVPATAAVRIVAADVVVDATSSDLYRTGWTAALGSVLARGGCVALAAKAALAEAAGEWLGGAYSARIGCNAVLGGTGRSFAIELAELRRRWRGVAIVGNASTTSIIEAVESGADFDEGIRQAGLLGYLEPDPDQDLRGLDAAVKLAIVAGALTGHRIDARTIRCEDIRDIDLAVVRARARRGATTRLVARLTPDGGARVAYEEVARDSLLATPCGRVVYEYRLEGGERRLHVGSGLGAEATAAALLDDVRSLARRTVTAQRPVSSAGAS
jgi:homoserine dehydrogenase